MTSSVATTTVATPNQGSQGAVTGAAAGAAQGAAVGSIVPGWGTVIGAVVGGVAGFVSGALQDKGKVYERMANKYAKQGKQREASIQIRDQLRQFRLQRATAMVMQSQEAGASQSSAPAGAISSMGNQYAFGAAFTDAQIYLQQQVQKYTKKAGRKYNSAQQGFAMIDAASTAVSAFGSLGGQGLFQESSPNLSVPEITARRI